MNDGLIEALHVDQPNGDETKLFGQFVGSWHLDWTGTTAAGEPASAQGELHVGYVLGGRAVQDVWIVPGRGEPGAGEPPLAFHGTTVRFYDSNLGAWRSTWIEPVNGLVRRFIGRPTDGGIELISDEDEPRLRWSFSQITPESFVWTGESSTDGGRSWRRDEQMRATRKA
jgi:hypothetical protein